MKCPYCSSDNTRVIDSRPADDNYSIRRRRLCDDCAKRFTTYEKVETIPLIIIKKDNTREQYNRSKSRMVYCAPATNARCPLTRSISLLMRWRLKSSIWKKKKSQAVSSGNW